MSDIIRLESWFEIYLNGGYTAKLNFQLVENALNRPDATDSVLRLRAMTAVFVCRELISVFHSVTSLNPSEYYTRDISQKYLDMTDLDMIDVTADGNPKSSISEMKEWINKFVDLLVKLKSRLEIFQLDLGGYHFGEISEIDNIVSMYLRVKSYHATYVTIQSSNNFKLLADATWGKWKAQVTELNSHDVMRGPIEVGASLASNPMRSAMEFIKAVSYTHLTLPTNREV